MNSKTRLLMAALLWIRAPAGAAAEDLQRWINEAVMPKASCRITLDGREVEPTNEHLPLFVVGVEEGRLSGIPALGGDEAVFAAKSVLRLKDAVDYYTQRIKADERDAWSYEMRGLARTNLSDASEPVYRLAAEDYTKAIELGRKSHRNYADRANIYYQLKDFGKALADIDEAIRIAPREIDCQVVRANLLAETGRWKESLAQFEAAIKADPELAEAQNDLAYLLATCSEASVRDGKRAVKLSLEACELADWQDYRMLDTLAAAYAEAGDFETAIAMQDKAIEMLEGVVDSLSNEFRARRKLYEQKTPYRESAPAK
ncbi:MAG: tetratricopeptide repeat protein [Planctomycetes bacterium]|nr:tetratricopeptide repeat protein [Planctomycetota bacterium]